MRGLRVRGGLESKTGACGRTVTTGSRSLKPYDSASFRVEVPEEEIGRSELTFTARLSCPTPSELIWFLLSFCTRHKPAQAHQRLYGNSLDPAPTTRMKVIVSMVSCSYLRCDTTMGGHPLQARMVLHHGFEWRQGPAYSRNSISRGHSAAHHDVRGCVTPDIGRGKRRGMALRMRSQLERKRVGRIDWVCVRAFYRGAFCPLPPPPSVVRFRERCESTRRDAARRPRQLWPPFPSISSKLYKLWR
jgi:hypothetical protein